MANTCFDWDAGKDAENQLKHGVSFTRAQYAFADPQRVIARDITHSQTEERFYCFGGLMAVCLRCDSPIAPPLFESSALAIGGNERLYMSAKTQRSEVSVKANAVVSRRYAGTKIKYTDEPLGQTQVVTDFLNSPTELAFREEGVKVTLALSKKVSSSSSPKPRNITHNTNA